MWLKVAYVVLFVSQTLLATKSHLFNRHADKYIQKTLNSLEKLGNFYRKYTGKINLDSVYGIRVAEGSLAMIVENMDKNGMESDGSQYHSRIQSLLKSLRKSANNAQPLLKKYQADYYIRFKPIVSKAWTYFKDFNGRRFNSTTHSSNIVENDRNSIFVEKVSDRCMTEIMGTANGQKKPCYISNKCLMLMTSHKLQGYGNTHQLLYFTIGFQHGCRNILEGKIQQIQHFTAEKDLSNVDTFLKKKCEQIFNEVKEPDSIYDNRDLFMEQGLVCGMLGYKEFLSYKILQDILSWQDSDYGCFGIKHQQFDHDENRFVSRNTMRKLLYDRLLSNGCSSHETGVATGLLGIYLRWLLTYTP